MTHLVQFLFSLIVSSARTRLSLQLEVDELRHQLSIYRAERRKPRISSSDRLLWSLVSKWLSGWRRALYFVRPRTVSERRMLGIDVAESTVERYKPRHRKPPSPSGRTILEQHAYELASIDFFVVPTARLKVLFVLVVLVHKRRRIVHFNVTDRPTAQWTAQQLTEAFPFDTAPRYLLRDGDGNYGRHVQRSIRSLGMKEVITAPASPWQNPFVERVLGSIRRELLDHVVVINKQHLKRLLSTSLDYYHPWRTHRSLAGDAPDHRPVRPAKPAQVVDFPAVHGLHHYYLPKVA